MSRKLFVANFPFSTSEEELRDLFEPFGPVEEIKIIYDRDTGRSRGFAFIIMESAEACQAAADEMNSTDLGGRSLAVRVAEPRRRNERFREDDDRQGPKRFALARARGPRRPRGDE